MENIVPVAGRAFVELAAPHYGVEFEWFEWPNILEYVRGGRYETHADAEIFDLGHGWRRFRPVWRRVCQVCANGSQREAPGSGYQD